MNPQLSSHFESRNPSAIRLAQIEFMKRGDDTLAINTAIGNVSLPMHPAMQKRMRNLGAEGSPFAGGVVNYTATVGTKETNDAFLHVIASSGFDTTGLYCQVMDGGSMGMELLILGVCGPAGTRERPLLLIDAAYTNYMALAERTGRKTISVQRHLQESGKFSLPDLEEIEEVIEKHKPGAMVVIPYDNPTGHFYNHETMVKLGKLCVKYNMWFISDEAYRELYYVKEKTSSIWGVTEEEVSGISGRRISVETSSKVWNGCGLRIGALVTDCKRFNEQSVAEYTANLCPNSIGQYIFGALAQESHEDLQNWYGKQREYYFGMLQRLTSEIKELLPGIIVSSPDASIYQVVDVRKIAENFDAREFVLYCAQKGRVDIDGQAYTLLVSPMAGFYTVGNGEPNPGKTQMRIAYVEPPERMKLVPRLFKELFEEYKKI